MNRIDRIQSCLQHALNPDVLHVIDESYQHRARSATETHIKIIAVSSHFAGQTLIARHRLINQLLAAEFSQGMHALSLSLYTPTEWEHCNGEAPASPPCAHQS